MSSKSKKIVLIVVVMIFFTIMAGVVYFWNDPIGWLRLGLFENAALKRMIQQSHRQDLQEALFDDEARIVYIRIIPFPSSSKPRFLFLSVVYDRSDGRRECIIACNEDGAILKANTEDTGSSAVPIGDMNCDGYPEMITNDKHGRVELWSLRVKEARRVSVLEVKRPEQWAADRVFDVTFCRSNEVADKDHLEIRDFNGKLAAVCEWNASTSRLEITGPRKEVVRLVEEEPRNMYDPR